MIDRTVIQQVRSRLAHRRSKVIGNAAELVVRSRLLLKGLVMVERIEVGWTLVRGPGGKIIGATPNDKVSGDWRALAPGGISVLVECKYRAACTRLTFSDLQPHQRLALDAHHAFGGLSLLAWVSPAGVRLLRWPVPGFVAGSGLADADAASLEWKP